MSRYDTIVIGAGLAGLTTACWLARENRRVLLIGAGAGALLLASGCIDLLSFQPAGTIEPLKNPLNNLDAFLAERPNHPYRFIGRDNIEAGIPAFTQLVNDHSLTYQGSPAQNWLLPSAAGAIRPTCLAPASLTRGELSQHDSMIIIGFNQLRDFYPALISQNLKEQDLGIQTASRMVELPSIPNAEDLNVTPVELAYALENIQFRQQLIQQIKSATRAYDRVGFPAVLGIEQHAAVMADLERQLGKPIFEISTLPPSVPGRRLYDRLRHIFVEAGGRIIMGSRVVDGTIEAGRVTQIQYETVNRLRAIEASHYVLATGGIYGGGIQTDSNGREGQVWEPIFRLPVESSTNRHNWFSKGFLDPKGQPFASFGIKVNHKLNPIDGDDNTIAENLYIAGATMAGADWTRGRTGEGVALSSAAAIVKHIVG